MNQPDSSGSTATPVLVEDVFVTEVFLIKGRLAGKNKRLTNVLEDYRRTFLPVHDATMVSLRKNEVIRTPTVMVNVNEVLFAHELLELAGDEGQRLLGNREKQTRIRAFYSGSVQFELGGLIEPGAYEQNPLTQRKYFIMQSPSLRGLDLAHPEMKVLSNLEYAIVRRDAMAYVYDFS
ncbi:MAG: hypothetical protein KDE27_21870 [Planctomycetes bacterium]|nr:hypothetical protein [Planctomycetota bacterium]